MNLRTKTMIIIGITLTVLMLFLNAVLRTLIISSFKQVEEQNVRDSVEQVLNVLQNDIANKNNFISDWAEWDDIYYFFKSQQSTQRDNPLLDAMFVQQRLNLIAYFDSEGQMLYCKEADLSLSGENRFSKNLQSYFAPGTDGYNTLKNLREQTSLHELMVLPEGPLLIVARPVLDHSRQGMPVGTMIVGYRLDNQQINSLARTTKLDVEVYNFNSLEHSKMMNEVKVALASAEPLVIRPQGETAISGYTLLRDIHDQPALILKVSMPRDVYNQGLTSLNIFMWSLFVVGIVFVTTLLLILDRLVLARVLKLDESIREVKNLDDLSLRIDLPGADELSNLAVSVNSMLDKLEKSQSELQRLLFTDALTGMYNRVFYEQEMQRLEESGGDFFGAAIMCDIDGLKFVNDTLGHEAGDSYIVEIARIIRQAVGKRGAAFRIGGDEFAVLVYENSLKQAEEICAQISADTMQYNSENPLVPLGLSVGCATGPMPIGDLIKDADAVMYRQKLNNGPNNRSAIVESFIKVADSRDCLSEGHGERVLNLVMAMGEAANLNQSGLYKLRVLAFFHDIGKVIIPEHLCQKHTAALNHEEMALIQSHCEVGKRIAHATPDLIPVADYILKHHERWDGSGYPLGLAGDDIPVECRILMLADSYDVMTSVRPYRRTLTHDEAIEEIKAGSGNRYDPALVEIFVAIMQDYQPYF